MGREITRAEAYEILVSGERDGRIVQIANTKNAENICSCCSCGCGMTKATGRLDSKNDMGNWWNNYKVSVESIDVCDGCARCQAACGFDVPRVVDGKVAISTERIFYCMGCGRCTVECRQGVLRLRRKGEEVLYEPPDTLVDARKKWHAIKVGEVAYEHAAH